MCENSCNISTKESLDSCETESRTTDQLVRKLSRTGGKVLATSHVGGTFWLPVQVSVIVDRWEFPRSQYRISSPGIDQPEENTQCESLQLPHRRRKHPETENMRLLQLYSFELRQFGGAKLIFYRLLWTYEERFFFKTNGVSFPNV